MIERLLAPIILGVVSSLAAGWLVSYWPALGTQGRWITGAAFGVAVAVVVFKLRNPEPGGRVTDRYGSGLSGGSQDVRVQRLDIETDAEHQTEVGTDLSSDRGVVVSDITVRRGQGGGGGSRRD